MSRGPGHVQRTILAMIEAEPHGAWTTGEIARSAYHGTTIEKKHRVAVLRALDKMKMPGTWKVRHQWLGAPEFCLFDHCDDESYMRADYAMFSWGDFDHWKESEHGIRARRYAGNAREYRDASPVKKIEIEIERKRSLLHLLDKTSAAPKVMECIAELTAERERLAAVPIAA